MKTFYRNYLIENVKEDIIVPFGEVYVITANYSQENIDYINDRFHGATNKVIQDLFIIPRESSLLQQILNEAKTNTYWKRPLHDDDFKAEVIFYIDGTSYSNQITFVHKFIKRRSRIDGDLINLYNWIIPVKVEADDFLRKVFNSLILNFEAHNGPWPYYVYLFNKRTRKFSVKYYHLKSDDECMFYNVEVSEVYKGIKEAFGTERLNQFKEKIDLKNYIPEVVTFMNFLEVYCDVRYELGIGPYHKDLCLSLAKAALKRENIPYNGNIADTGETRYW